MVAAQPEHVEHPSVRDSVSGTEWRVRVQLAACYRLFARFGMTDLIYNHITARIPGTEHVLINGYGLLYDEITASNLHTIDLDGNYVVRASGGFGVNPAGFIIHAAVHAYREDAGCVIHTHSRAATAVSAMECGLLPLSQGAVFFHGVVAYHDFEGPVIDGEEGHRLAADLGARDIMVLRNHGTLTVGRNVAHAFLQAYQLENACRIQVDAMGAGPLVMPSDEIAAAAPDILRKSGAASEDSLEWRAMLRLLDRDDGGYDQ